MNTREFSYWFWEAVIPADVCQTICDDAEKIAFKEGGVGSANQVDKKIRNNMIAWMPRLHLIEGILTSYALEANFSAGWHLDLSHVYEPVQIAKYSRNQFYGSHNDLLNFEALPTHERKLTAILFLSDDQGFNGGGLEVGNQLVKTKKQGSIVVFPVYMSHEVKPVTKGVRHSATCWIAGPRFK